MLLSFFSLSVGLGRKLETVVVIVIQFKISNSLTYSAAALSLTQLTLTHAIYLTTLDAVFPLIFTCDLKMIITKFDQI